MIIGYVGARCNQWAEWYLRREALGMGYPRECPYTRLQARGGQGYNQTFDEAAWEIHQAINGLDPVLKLAVYAFYIRKGTIEQRSRDCGCSFKTLYRRVEEAHLRIMEWLNDETAGVPHPVIKYPLPA